MQVMGAAHHIGKEDEAALSQVEAILEEELMEQEGFLLAEVSMQWMTWSLGRAFTSFTPLMQSDPSPHSHSATNTFAPLSSTLVCSASMKGTWRAFGGGFVSDARMVGKE